MFANTQMLGMDIGFPDVTLAPTPTAPVPIPYPNIADVTGGGSTTSPVNLGSALPPTPVKTPDPAAIWEAFSHYTDGIQGGAKTGAAAGTSPQAAPAPGPAPTPAPVPAPTVAAPAVPDLRAKVVLLAP
jgi:hypothetical protein